MPNITAPQDYFMTLQPLIYEGKEEAKVSLKEFMSTNIRLHLPSIYRNLVTDWPALNHWNELSYLRDTVGYQLVLAYNYLAEHRDFAGTAILNNQVAHPMTINSFLDLYLYKFYDTMLRSVLDATNLFFEEPVPEKLKNDFSEPDAINVALDLESVTWSLMSRSAQTMTRYNDAEMLHCVVSGEGEHFTLVSPYQRRGIAERSDELR